MSNEYEPKIVLFACNWCTYAALDLAGTSRMKYPPNFRVIKAMCSGRIDPQFIVEAFNVLNRANITGVYSTQYALSTNAADCGPGVLQCLVPQNTGTTAFGAPSDTLGPRILQLAVKLLF